jgi:hypothetical protein
MAGINLEKNNKKTKKLFNYQSLFIKSGIYGRGKFENSR